MATLRKRSIVLKKDEEINVKNLEEIHRYYDDRIREIDSRRLSQQTELSDSATLANVITAFNALAVALNGSDLTED